VASDINTDQSGHLSSAAHSHTPSPNTQQWSGPRVKLIINAMASWKSGKLEKWRTGAAVTAGTTINNSILCC